jgi:hypothetical protein
MAVEILAYSLFGDFAVELIGCGGQTVLICKIIPCFLSSMA